MPERVRNPFTQSTSGARILSALQLPYFLIRPPDGYGVLTTTGRTTRKRRRRCVRIVRLGDRAYVVAIKGSRTGWLRNLRATPEVRVRLRGGTFHGRARELTEPTERAAARHAYCDTLSPYFEYLEHMMWRTGRPTRHEIDRLHGKWFDGGVPVAIDLIIQPTDVNQTAASSASRQDI